MNDLCRASAEYLVCKRRGHEQTPVPDPSNREAYKAYQMSAQQEWLTCRWCGIKFREVMVKKQIEKE
jgi:hypothetical protein